MNNTKRILFSFETADEWIFQAYRGFFDSLAEGPYEIFCTVSGSLVKKKIRHKFLQNGTDFFFGIGTAYE